MATKNMKISIFYTLLAGYQQTFKVIHFTQLKINFHAIFMNRNHIHSINIKNHFKKFVLLHEYSIGIASIPSKIRDSFLLVKPMTYWVQMSRKWSDTMHPVRLQRTRHTGASVI